jgi:hemolysin activation/secretion protein
LNERRAGYLFAVVLLVAASAGAQSFDRPVDRRPELPAFEPEPDAVLPRIEAPSELGEERLSSGPAIRVRGFRITGSTVFSEAELEALVTEFVGRSLTSEDLVEVRNRITRHYIDRGYVTSGALIPDQDPVDGVIEIRIVEGSIAEIEIRGNEGFRAGMLRRRIALGAAAPVDLTRLERELQILQQDPLIERVNAHIRPGTAPGLGILDVTVEEARRWNARAEAGNYEPPSIGAYRGRFAAEVANLIGWGDTLHTRYTVSEGLQRFDGRYEIPFTAYGTALDLRGEVSRSEVVENPLDDLDLSSEYESFGIGFSQPLHRTTRSTLLVGVLAEWRRTTSKLDGSRFTFPDSGSDDGRSQVAVLRFYQEWTYRGRNQVFAARSTLSRGLDILGATDGTEGPPDATFLAWLAQVQWAVRFGPTDLEAILRTDLQLTSSPLLSLEQFAVGGHASVRGYRENQLVRDQGWVSSIELRQPVWRWPDGVSRLELLTFFDNGRSWNSNRPSQGQQSIRSVGLGLRFAVTRFIDAQITWGEQLKNVDTSGDLQDDGVQFRVEVRVP